MNNIVLFIVIYLVTSASMKGLIWLARKYDLQEHPQPDLARKIHREPKPYTASIGVFGIFWLAVLVMSAFEGHFIIPPLVMIGALLLFIVSFLDDYFKIKGKSFPIAPRFLTHIIAAVLV